MELVASLGLLLQIIIIMSSESSAQGDLNKLWD